MIGNELQALYVFLIAAALAIATYFYSSYLNKKLNRKINLSKKNKRKKSR